MYHGIDRERNLLEITDAEIANDWKLGMARSAAKLLASSGKVSEGIGYGAWGSVTSIEEGSLAAHLYPTRRIHMAPACTITGITNLVEQGTERYEHNSFGEGSTYVDATLSGVATCKCGLSANYTYSTSMGELIYEIVNADPAAPTED